MRKLPFVILFASLALLGCAPKADLDKAKAEIEQLTSKVATLERLNTEQYQRITELEAVAGRAASKLAAAEQQLNRKPAMPVRVSLRKGLLGTGYVVVFSTTIKQDFPVLVTVKSKALGTTKQIRVNLSGNGTTEVGSNEGLSVDLEDEMILENTNYESATLKFKQ